MREKELLVIALLLLLGITLRLVHINRTLAETLKQVNNTQKILCDYILYTEKR